MKLIKLALISSALCAVSAAAAFADCGIESGSVRILSNDFPALHAVNDGAAACASGAVEVTINQTADHNDIQVAALTANPAQYTVAVVANSSIVSLLNEDLIRPLDDLVDRFKSNHRFAQNRKYGPDDFSHHIQIPVGDA